MPGEESVKGTLVLGAAVKVRRLRDGGNVGPGVLEARLSKRALELLDEKIESARWYPIGAFCELLDFDWEHCGHREPGYMENQGARSAEKMFATGRYQQLDFADRSRKVESRDSLRRQSRLITSITASLYNFLEYEVKLSPRSLDIIYANARSFGDALMHTTVGFMNHINARQGSKRRWRAERVDADHVRYEMLLPERLSEED